MRRLEWVAHDIAGDPRATRGAVLKRTPGSLPKPIRLSKRCCDPEDSSGFKVSRHTVRKVVRTGETSCSYKRKVQSIPKLGSWVDELERRLQAAAGKARRDRLSLLRMYGA